MSVYRSECPDYLDRALQSVWDDQTLKPNQIVLVEDGFLDDKLQQVISKWKIILKDVLALVVNEKNLGLTKSLNKGLKVVTSDLIARMDSDDISTPHRFELQHSYLVDHNDIDIVGGSLQEFNNDNDCLNVRYYPATHEQVIKTMHKASPLAHPTVMMRKRMFDNGLCYDERYRMSQDIALWYDAVLQGYRIANLQDITLKFRRDGDVYKRRSKAKAKNEFLIYMKGIRKLDGLFSFKYIYPIMRYIFRMMPITIVKWGYNSNLRKILIEDDKKLY